MSFHKLRCLDCGRNYNAFIFEPDEKGNTPGWDLQQFQCPNCHSTKKARYGTHQEVINNKNNTERMKSMKDVVQNKLFHIHKPSEKEDEISKQKGV